MKPSVYVETTIVSYLVGRLNPANLQVAANQELTRLWWETRAHQFELFASAVVFDEAADGDADRASERLELLSRTTMLLIPQEAFGLQFQLLGRAALPANAVTDALHIAIAAVHEMQYLATWNCKHIANAISLPRVYDVCRRAGYEPPLICTPYELMGPDHEGL